MDESRYHGVFEDRKKLYTINQVKGRSVYGETLKNFRGTEYRQWDPTRSKLCAAMMKKVNLPTFSDKATWLYLGCSYGTTVSHVSDMVPKGMIYALDFAPRVMRNFYFMSGERSNIAPILGDAKNVGTYEYRIPLVDILFQDVAQRAQVDIFLKNFRFVKKGGYGILSVKARSMDVAKKPRVVFEEVRKKLQGKVEIIDYKSLAPFEADHAMFVCKKKN